jgi:hypothetical protein
LKNPPTGQNRANKKDADSIDLELTAVLEAPTADNAVEIKDGCGIGDANDPSPPNDTTKSVLAQLIPGQVKWIWKFIERKLKKHSNVYRADDWHGIPSSTLRLMSLSCLRALDEPLRLVRIASMSGGRLRRLLKQTD